MKHVLIFLVFTLNALYGYVGFGFSGGLNSIRYDNGGSPLILDNGNEVGEFSYDGFNSARSLGGYLYIDALPIIDLDLELNLKLSPYKFVFSNDVVSSDTTQFVWLSSSLYMTIQKELFKKTIPWLAKIKVFAGGGINNHSSTPMINQNMLEAVMGGSESLEDGNFDSTEMIKYLEDKKIDVSGFHVQVGGQFKVLIFDSMLLYRYIFTDGITPDTKGFSDFSLRFGYAL